MLFIFDVDGTLLDTSGDIGSACNHVLKNHGFGSLPLRRYPALARDGFKNIFGAILPGLPAEQNELLAKEAWQEYQGNMTNHTAPYAGIKETLYALANLGHCLAVLSDKPDEMVKALATKYFGDVPFEPVYGRIPGLPKKPDPARLLAIMGKTGNTGESAFYVGDSPRDVETAHAAGAGAIGAAWGFYGRSHLLLANPEFIADQPTEILRLPRGYKPE